MGIPRLISHLQPYAVTTILGCKKENCPRHQQQEHHERDIIIDGPGLAYHLYHRLLAQKPTSLNAYDAVPSYAEVGHAVVAYLDELQNYGLTVKRVFFDGYLPSHKQNIRLTRLENSTKELVAFHTIHPSHLTNASDLIKREGTQAPSIQCFSSQSPPLQFRGFPASPFLVPVVLDALTSSQYVSRVQIVPGEAEAYCAAHLRHEGAITLTGDSDMLVYDLSNRGAVAFFNQLESRTMTPCDALKTALFRTSQIAKGLNLINLQRLAFEIKQDPHIKVGSAVRLSHCPTGNLVAFTEFLAEYALPLEIPSPPSLAAAFSFLDPRLSELVLSTSYSSPNSSCPPIYLPFLIDDPSRSSAWLPSLSFRRLLFSLLPFLTAFDSRSFTVQEFIRKGQGIAPTNISLFSECNLSDFAAQFCIDVQCCFDVDFTGHCWAKWWLFALCRILAWYRDSEKAPPASITIQRLFQGAKASTWDDVHLRAQVEGVLYSLRLLKQLSSSLRADERPLPSEVRQLWGVLEKLPDLSALLPSRAEMAVGTEDIERFVTIAIRLGRGIDGRDEESVGEQEEVGRVGEDFDVVGEGKKKGRRRRGKKQQLGAKGSVEASEGCTRHVNPYGLLATELVERWTI